MKKILATSVFGLLALSGIAFAQTVIVSTTTPVATQVATPTVAEPMILQIGVAGKVLLRGTIVSVSTNSITVKSWGGDWTINVPTSAQVLPQGIALSSFQVGDFIGVQGTINQGANWTIDATLVRDWTARQVMTQEIKQNVQSVRQEMQANTPRILQGTLSNLTGQSFTLTTSNGTAYSVTVASGAKVLKNNWVTLDLTQVQNGDMVRVWGPVSSSTVSAEVFRDTSIAR
jgi:hypothetical protein